MKISGFSEIWFLRIVVVLACLLIVWEELSDRGYLQNLHYILTRETPDKYTFTEDWFYKNIQNWEELLAPYKDKPGVKYLEIGVFEGRSALWVLENILTHPASHMTAVDIFTGDYEKTFLENLERSGKSDQVDILKGDSKIVLRNLSENTFDIIYIDGSHIAKDVLADAILSWPLLKTGGLIIFDDFYWNRDKYPFELRPDTAIESFVSIYQKDLDIIRNSPQVVVRKLPEICYTCIRIGQYAYSWKDKNITRLSDNEVFHLNRTFISHIEKELRKKDFGIKGIIEPDLESWIDQNLENFYSY